MSFGWLQSIRGLSSPRVKPGSASSIGILGSVAGLDRLEIGGQISPVGSEKLVLGWKWDAASDAAEVSMRSKLRVRLGRLDGAR